MLDFCSEEISWSDMFDDFSNIYDKYTEIEDVSPLQGVALAMELSDAIIAFKDKLAMVSMKGLICAVLTNIDIDAQVQDIEQEITKFFNEFSNFDEAIASINKDGFQSLQEIEDAVRPIFDSFDQEKEEIKRQIREGLRILFSPLLEIGATQEQIDSALEDIELQSNPVELIIEVFTDVAQQTVNNL